MVTRNRLGPQAIGGPAIVTYNAPGLDDPRTPGVPTGLTGYGSVYLIPGGGYASAATLHWTPPTADSNGDPMTPDSTQIWGRKVVTGSTFAQLVICGGLETDLTVDGFKPGETWQFKLRSASLSGKASGYSNTISVVMPTQNAPPPRPSVPTLFSRLGAVNIAWDGKATGGGTMPPDLKYVRVDRCADSNFTTGVTKVDTIAAGIAVDAPLTVGAIWFYRLVAVDNAGNESDPSSYASIKVDGVTGPDIPAKLIDETKLAQSITDDIDKALADSSAAMDSTSDAAKIFLQPNAPTTGMTSGDLWYDSSHGNTPYRYQITPTVGWISVRDATLNAAFPTGVSLASGFLDANVVQAKFISAGTVDAKNIISSGTITSTSGVIGSLDAGAIKTGILSADRIGAASITAGKMVLGDTENLVSEPGFKDDGPWTGNGIQATVSDLPASGSGNAWQFTGNASTQTAWNSQISPANPDDEFYGECWVRKTASATTGTAALVMLIQRKGTTDTSVTLVQRTYKTTDAANSWVQLTGSGKIPAGGYSVKLAVRIGTDVVSGNIQFSQVMLRRKLQGSLIVDGTITGEKILAGEITTAHLAASSVTAAKILANSITADRIATNAITANELAAGSVTAVKIAVNSITADRIAANAITASEIATGAVTAAEIAVGTITGNRIAGNQISAGHLIANSVTASKIAAGQISSGHIVANAIHAGHILAGSISAAKIGAGQVIAGKLGANSVYASNIRANSITAAHIGVNQITASKIGTTALDGKTITGSTVRSASSGRRVQMTTGGLAFYNSSNLTLLNLVTSNSSFYIRSNASGAHFILDNSGFRLYNSSGTNTVNLANNGGATFRGTVTASAINSPTINGARFSGTQSGGTFSNPGISGGSWGGVIQNGATVSGGTVRTSSGGNRVELAGDQIRLYSGGSLGGYVRGDPAASGVNIVPASTGRSVFIGAGTGGIQVTGNNYTYSRGIYNNTNSGGAAVYVQSNGWLTRHTSSSRYKTKIRDLPLAAAFMRIRTATWLDKPNPSTVFHRLTQRGGSRFTGFLADNLHQIGLGDMVVYDELAHPDSISVPSILAHTVRYVQHLVTQVDELTQRVAELEGAPA